MQTLGPCHWAEILVHLTCEERAAVFECFSAAREGGWLLARRVKSLAKLVTFANARNQGPVVVASPTSTGYVIDTYGALPTFTSTRRMFVHHYASTVARLVEGPTLVVSLIAYDTHTAREMSLCLEPSVVVKDLVVATLDRFLTRVTNLDVRSAVLQHARGYVAMRLPVPSKYAGRRARIWTKVSAREQLTSL